MELSRRRESTSEIAMHLTIYQMRPDISAVVHAHPPVATGDDSVFDAFFVCSRWANRAMGIAGGVRDEVHKVLSARPRVRGSDQSLLEHRHESLGCEHTHGGP